MTARPPVQDWANDFDHLDQRWIEDPHPIWDELRSRCPIAHTDRFKGVYFPSRYEDVRTIAYDTEHFSSRYVVVREDRSKIPPGAAPPITSDPPAHRSAKLILLPPFTPDAVKCYEPVVRQLCRSLIDRFITKKTCDGAVDYAQEIPARVIAMMLGVPQDHGDQFRTWIHEILEVGITDLAVLQRAREETARYFAAEIAKRRASPDDGLISYLVGVRIEGRALSDAQIIDTARLLLIAGIDTTWSAIGSCIWHLARYPDDSRRLASDPGLMPSAVEEFLRAYAPVTMAREVVKEVEINGCRFKPGEMVLLSFPAANRDPAVFEGADRVVIDRAKNRHVAFGLGIHRCVGSNLARMEIAVALEEWLKLIPEFWLDPDAPVKWSEGTVRGPRQLPLIIGSGRTNPAASRQ